MNGLTMRCSERRHRVTDAAAIRHLKSDPSANVFAVTFVARRSNAERKPFSRGTRPFLHPHP